MIHLLHNSPLIILNKIDKHDFAAPAGAGVGCKVGEVTLSRAYWVGTIIRAWQELDEYTQDIDVEKMPRVWTGRRQSRYATGSMTIRVVLWMILGSG